MTDLHGPAEILHQGYRSFDGEREGLSAALRAIVRATARALLGIGRSGGAKVLPILVTVWAVLPAVIYMGVLILFEIDPENLGEDLYAGYYGQIATAIIIFVSFVAPISLLGDRSGGLLAYYLSSRLTSRSYLLAKTIAIVALLMLVTTLPLLFMLVGFVVQGVGPDGADGFALQLLRIVCSGLLVAVFYTAISMAGSALADKRLYASVGLVVTLIAAPFTAFALTENGGLSDQVHLLNLFRVPIELVYRIYGRAGLYPSIDTLSLVGANAAWILGCFALVLWRYRGLEVSR